MKVVARYGDDLIVVTGEVAQTLPARGADSPLLLPARRYDPLRDSLSEEMWLGSFVKFGGGYFTEPGLDAEGEQRVLDRVAALLDEDAQVRNLESAEAED